MNRKQWLVVIGAMSLVVGGCGGGPPKSAEKTEALPGPTRHTVAGFLSDTGRRKAFNSNLVASLCQLEGGTKGLDSIKRICPTGNPKDVPIPTYPPKE